MNKVTVSNFKGYAESTSISFSDLTINVGMNSVGKSTAIQSLLLVRQAFDEIKKYIPSFTKGYEGKIIIKNDELMYKDIVTEKESEWFEDIGVKLNAKTALDIAKEPKKYYGQKVTNYESNGVSDWKIFYSDEKNIYLITSEYLDVDKLPATSSGAKPQKGDSTYSKAAVYGSDVQANYSSGSDSITDERIKSLNN